MGSSIEKGDVESGNAIDLKINVSVIISKPYIISMYIIYSFAIEFMQKMVIQFILHLICQ